MIGVRLGGGTVVYVEGYAQLVPFVRAVDAWIEDRGTRPGAVRWPPPYDVEYGEGEDR